MSDMAISGKYREGINPDNLEHHRDENADDWKKNLGFGRKVQLLNKGHRFKTRH